MIVMLLISVAGSILVNRIEKQEREDERWRKSYNREQKREEAKRSGPAYREGRRKGSDINLDSQLKEGIPQKHIS